MYIVQAVERLLPIVKQVLMVASVGDLAFDCSAEAIGPVRLNEEPGIVSRPRPEAPASSWDTDHTVYRRSTLD